MKKSNARLALSGRQQTIVADLGIDAWYLQPIQQHPTKSQEAHDALIDELVHSIEQADERTTAPTTSTLAEPKPAMVTTAAQTVSASTTPTQVKHNARKAIAQPPRISLAANNAPRILTSTSHVMSTQPCATSWEHLQNMVSESYTFQQHNLEAPECIVLSESSVTPHQKDDPDLSQQALQLLSEITQTLSVTEQQQYRTAMMKKPTTFGQEPTAEEIAHQKAILASELALVRPKRIWAFGKTAAQALTQPTLPISQLVMKQHHLQFLGIDGQALQAILICLPALDYLLAMPADKAIAWHTIKQLQAHNPSSVS